MTYVDIAGGFFIGFLFGIGTALFYLRWKMKKQIGSIEEQMDAVMDLSEGMAEGFDQESMMELEEEKKEDVEE